MAELAEWVALLDACVEPIATRPVDMTDTEWPRTMREAPHPLDEAGVRADPPPGGWGRF